MKSKVAVIPCAGYERERVYEAVERGIDLLGGWESFVKPGEKILLKPNLLKGAEPDRAVTTHPAVFEAAARSLKEKGFGCLSYGDSPGFGSPEKAAGICGIKAAADGLEIPLADFSRSRTVNYVRGRTSRSYEICQGVLDSDGIVNLCKMKTHQLERITGAVKNMFGCVFGMNKGAAHAKYPDAESFARMLVDLNLLLKARIHIMDGVVAMEGNGPASGEPVNMNLILISADPVALDATFCRLVDLDPPVIPTVFYGSILGLGRWKEDDIDIVGVNRLDGYRNLEFDVLKESGGKWAYLDKLKIFSRKPVILKNKCIRCGVCVAACPLEEKAVSFPMRERGESRKAGAEEPSVVASAEKEPPAKGQSVKEVPVYDYNKCIRCYCCQEMCPEKAIIVKRRFMK